MRASGFRKARLGEPLPARTRGEASGQRRPRAAAALLAIICVACQQPAEENTASELRETAVARSAAERLQRALSPRGRATTPGSLHSAVGAEHVERLSLQDGRIHPRLPAGLSPEIHSAVVELPRRGDEPFRITERTSGLSVEVALLGAAPSATEAAGTLLVFPGAHLGADVLHVPGAAGVEDYVWIEQKAERAEVAYVVQPGPGVAGLRLVENVLEVIDAGGAPRLRMNPPWLVDAGRKRHDARVAIRGCAYDTHPAGPWGRPPVAPGADRCLVVVSWDGEALQYPAVLDPAWVTTGSMAVRRHGLAGTVLLDGNVLVCGGQTDTVAQASCELFNPTTRAWSSTSSQTNARAFGRMTTLPDGTALITGGQSSSIIRHETRRYSPGTGTWTQVGSLNYGRYRFGAVRLADGRYLVAGGFTSTSSSSATTTAEIFNPETNAWSLVTNMNNARANHAMVRLDSGKVLVAGGLHLDTVRNTSETFDPATPSSPWQNRGNLLSARSHIDGVQVAPGQALVAGGWGGSVYLASTEMFSESTGTWAAAGNLLVARSSVPLVPLTRTLFAAMGGNNSSSQAVLDVFDTPGGSWRAGNLSATIGRTEHLVLRLADGVLLVAGGNSTSSLDSSQLYSEGQSCGSSADCEAGTCVNGFCCNAPCTAPCGRCDIATREGLCWPVASGSPGAPSCSPYVCNGSVVSCPLSCSSHPNCDSTSYCASNACVPKKANGATCSTTAECVSGNCIDGVCCDAPCTENCRRCNLTGLLGTCSRAPAGNSGNPSCSYYLCDGDSDTCPTSCDDHADCASSGWCNGSQCVARKAVGAACVEARECTNSQCVDGYCCNATCDQPCDVCSLALGASANGTCTIAAGNPGDPSCFPFLCQSSSAACPASCSTDTQCAAGYYCNGTSCVLPKANGATCTRTLECASGNCANGYCCNTACTENCRRCDLAGAQGTCTRAPSGATPSPSCGYYLCEGTSDGCPGGCDDHADCVAYGYCDGGGCVARKGLGGVCSEAFECTSGFCADGRCCNTACAGACDFCSTLLGAISNGTCAVVVNSPGSPSCTPFVCQAGISGCPTTCTSDTHCATTAYCTGTTCQAKKALGTTCTRGPECMSGNCINGFCCDTPCAEGCRRCDLAGAQGTCSRAPEGDLGSPSCTPFVCSGASDACPTSCASHANCRTTHYCSGGACIADKATGSNCAEGAECQSGFCADGRCCSTACGGACEFCNLAGALGTCTIVDGAAGVPSCAPYLCRSGSSGCPGSCLDDNHCSSGNYCSGGACVSAKAIGETCSRARECLNGTCVDGRCCNSTCSGGCDRCDVASSPGVCTVLPAGSTGANPACGAYLCNGTSAACPTSCVSSATCASGYYCNGSGQCVGKKTNGSLCGSGDECGSGHCSDGYCCNTACSGSCDTCSQALGASANGTCTLVSGLGNPSCAPYVCRGLSAACPNSCSTDSHCSAGSYCTSGGLCVARKSNGESCTAANECQTGHCVDGYCCNNACGGACDRCDNPGARGSCQPAPAGTTPSANCGAYLCNGSSTGCPANCVDDLHCVPSAFCLGGLCLTRLENGNTCNRERMCLSDRCVDGYCCNGACTGACDRCDVPGWQGNCRAADLGYPGVPSCAPYVCTGSSASCPPSCSSDLHCTAGYFCYAGTCTNAKRNGQSCSVGADCASGHCADGVCCDTDCAGGCNRCNLPLSVGTCSNVAAGNGGDSPICFPYVCSGTSPACPASCTTAANCAPFHYCDGGTCRPHKQVGETCTAAAQCGSGYCVDGVCCSSPCAGACDVCSVALGASTDGTCRIVPGSTGAPSCTPYLCSSSSASCPTGCSSHGDCVSTHYCAGSCLPKKGPGQACSATAECAAGVCSDGVCCDRTCAGSCETCTATPGTCTLRGAGSEGSPTCFPHRCTASSGACGTTCSADSHCAAGAWCNAGTCAPKKGIGLACEAANECAGGHCVDGNCCNSACDGACDACSVAAGGPSNGTCSLVAPGHAGNPVCGNYVCSGAGAGCPTSCSSDAVCAAGAYCNGSQCVPRLADGQTCPRSRACASDKCVDGVCCNATCAGGCDRCDLPGLAGICSAVPAGDPGTSPSCSPFVCSGSSGACPVSCSSDAACRPTHYCQAGNCLPRKANGQACGGDGQCASGYCVGGTCCDSPCTGGCEACNASGLCLAVAAGSPGSKTPSCSPYLCDGTIRQCPASCTPALGCAGAHWCDQGSCRPKLPNGDRCLTAAACSSGFCSDDVCCNAACNGPCDSCSVETGASADGTCTLRPGAAVAACLPYLCRATSASCPASCGQHADCAEGYYCGGAACLAKKALGESCTGAVQCASGNCADSVCCDAACAGACDACAVAAGAAANGRCTVLAPGSGGNPSCGAYLCGGGASCPSGCSDASACAAGHYCDGAACVPKKAKGAGCAGAGECLSGTCADGVCCDGACAGSCQACSRAEGALADGTCTALEGTPGRPSCAPYLCRGAAACPSSCASEQDCAAGHWCDAGACRPLKALGEDCAGARECLSGSCVDGYCCDGGCSGACEVCSASLGAVGNGICTPVRGSGTPSCAPYLCDGAAGVCPSACGSDSDCEAGWRCAGSRCVARSALGTECSFGGECLSGFCVDGVCCNSECAEQCAACDSAGSRGSCLPVAGSPRGGRAACGGSGVCAGACDGVSAGSCRFPGEDRLCAAPTCTGGVGSLAAGCRGDGTCAVAVQVECAPFVCGANACLGTCFTRADCEDGFACFAGSCLPLRTSGEACSRADQCASGYCADGVCCDRACGGGCERCDLAGSAGACVILDPARFAGASAGLENVCAPFLCGGTRADCPAACAGDEDCIPGHHCDASGLCLPRHRAGVACERAGECTSGSCVDGVCCDSACEGSCVSCALAGSVGRCTPVRGTAAPGREACAGSGACAGYCNGANAACVFPGAELVCEKPRCAEAVAHAASACDGAGGCVEGAATACGAAGCSGITCSEVVVEERGFDCATGPRAGTLALLAAALLLLRRRRRNLLVAA